MPDRLYLIDGTALIYRSFFAIRSLSNSKGEPTNAAFGFARAILKLLREQKPSHIIMVFDAPGKTFRDDMYEAYKATRPETPGDLKSQLPMIDEIVSALNMVVLREPNVEADDVIGTLCTWAEEQGIEAVVVSGDKDALQLVTERVRIYDPWKGDAGQWYGPAEVVERYGVPAANVIDVLALMGDASDNVPGVRGIGEKTARQLLQTYRDLEGIYAQLDELKGKQRERLEQDRDLAFLSRELVTIKRDVPLNCRLDQCKCEELDAAKLAAIFEKLEFRSLTEEFTPKGCAVEELDYKLVLTEADLDRVVKEMTAAGRFSVDTETTSVDPMRAHLVGISLSCRPCTGYYIPVGHAPSAMVLQDCPGETGELFAEPVPALSKDRVLERLRPLLESPEIGKVGHNIKYDIIVFARAGVTLSGVRHDTMVASYLTDPSRFRHNLDEVSLHYLKRKLIPISDVIGKGAKSITFDNVPITRACEYASEDADIAWRLAEMFEPILRERGVASLYEELELPLIFVLARMEAAGIAIDAGVFSGLRRELETRLDTLEAEITEAAGVRFQINSPKQLQEILFGKLGLRPVRKTKTGYSTDVDVLEELARHHPLPALLLEYRGLEKLRGTYVDALPKLVHPETGRIHTSFNQAVAATGRLSSSDPNLQNIPIRTEMGRRIRRGFVPGGPDERLISADYSQIELRLLAHLSGDENLCEAFHRDEDIHRDTAARVFGVAPEDVDADMRRQAKAVNFGVVYGISPFGLSKNLGIGTQEAARFIDSYFASYPRVKEWIEGTLEAARRDGYVTTLLNRRRYVPELLARDQNARRGAERVAINTPVQGSAADIIKVAMVRLDRALKGRRACLVLQVHDELLVEAHKSEAEEVAHLVRDIMQSAFPLSVPLKVDVGIGTNWAEIH